MALDFTAPSTKASALSAYSAAVASPDMADWQAIAAMLAQHLAPKPKKAIEFEAGEWCEYTEAQRKGRGGLFHASRCATFMFADGASINVSLCHRMSLDLPDWARAARCAVSFYKAKRSAAVLRAMNNFRPGYRSGQYHHYMAHDSRADMETRALPVPEIVDAVDVTRNVVADVGRCNAATLADRS